MKDCISSRLITMPVSMVCRLLLIYPYFNVQFFGYLTVQSLSSPLKNMIQTPPNSSERLRCYRFSQRNFLSKEQNVLLCVTRRNWRIDVSVKHLSKVACQSRAYLRVILPTPTKRARTVLFS